MREDDGHTNLYVMRLRSLQLVEGLRLTLILIAFVIHMLAIYNGAPLDFIQGMLGSREGINDTVLRSVTRGTVGGNYIGGTSRARGPAELKGRFATYRMKAVFFSIARKMVPL
ncbi:hypothetical protein C7820_1446 [Paenibacillus sp. VMFN-D1]|nr:hypothetical protein C7820_1446 [Paenibacillus sp. VMFN-D1]